MDEQTKPSFWLWFGIGAAIPLLYLVVALAGATTRTTTMFLTGDNVTLSEPVVGCVWSTYDRLDGLAAARDQAAFDRLVADQIRSGGCVVFRRDDTVYVEDVALFAGATQLRRRGDTKSWWVTSAMLDRSQKTGRLR